MSISALSGCREIYYTHEAAELVFASFIFFFPHDMRSKGINKKIQTQTKMWCVSPYLDSFTLTPFALGDLL